MGPKKSQPETDRSLVSVLSIPHSNSTFLNECANSLLDFARSLPDCLRHQQRDPSDSNLSADLQSHTDLLRSSGSKPPSAQAQELDRHGTTLWNLTTHLKFEAESLEPASKATRLNELALLRVFAFHLLHGAQQHRGERINSVSTLVRLLKSANKTIKFCLEHAQPPASLRIFEDAADIEDTLAQRVKHKATKDDIESHRRLKVEYLGLRMLQVSMRLATP